MIEDVTKNLLLGPVAELYRILLKRFHIIDEELHLLRQVIHFQSSLSNPSYLTSRKGQHPLNDRGGPDQERQGERPAYSEPAPFLFESLLEVTSLQANEVSLLLDDLIDATETLGKHPADRRERARMLPWMKDEPPFRFYVGQLQRFARAFEATLEGFNRAQVYFIQRCEETSPSSLNIPRVFKREAEKTISLVERTYRAYRAEARRFVNEILGGAPQGAQARANDKTFESALSFEHLWSARVLTTRQRTIEEFNLFTRPEGSLPRRYALIGGESALLELPRFIPNLAHEVAHIMLVAEAADANLDWEQFADRPRRILLALRSDLERFLLRETDLLRRAERAADAHINEMLADLVALYVSGPYYLHSLFYSLAAQKGLEEHFLHDVPFFTRLELLLEVIRYRVDRTATDGAGWVAWSAEHLGAIERYIAAGKAPITAPGTGARPRPHPFNRLLDGYLRLVRRHFLDLVDYIEHRMTELDAEHRSGSAADRPIAECFFRPTVLSEAELSTIGRFQAFGASGAGTDARPTLKKCGFVVGFAPALERWSQAQDGTDPEARLHNEASADLSRVIVHLLNHSIHEEVRRRPADADVFAKPHELRLFHALHRGRAAMLSRLPTTVECGLTAGPVVRVYQYTYHWNAPPPGAPPMQLSLPRGLAGQSAEFAKFIAFGDVDAMYFREKCHGGAAERLGRDARKYRSPALVYGRTDAMPGGAVVGDEESHSSYAQQRDYLDVTRTVLAHLQPTAALEAKPAADDLRNDGHLIFSQIRFARREHLGAGRARGEKPGSTLDHTVALCRRLQLVSPALDGVHLRRVLCGYGWEDVALVWSIKNAADFGRVVRHVFSGYFGEVQSGEADPAPPLPIERLVTTTLVADNWLHNYLSAAGLSDDGQALDDISGLVRILRRLAEMSGQNQRLSDCRSRSTPVPAAPMPSAVENDGGVVIPDAVKARESKLAEEPPPYVEFCTTCTLVNRSIRLAQVTVGEFERAVTEALRDVAPEASLRFLHTSSSIDLLLLWRFVTSQYLDYMFAVITAGLSYLIRRGVILNSTTRWTLPAA